MENLKVHKLVESWEAYCNQIPYRTRAECFDNLLDYACKLDATAREYREAKRQIEGSGEK